MVDYTVLASVIIALLGGGALVKLVELFLNRSQISMSVSKDERENLRNDILSLRQDIKDMREELAYLRKKLNEKTIELAKSTKNFFALKLVIEKIVIYLRSIDSFRGDDRLESLIKDAYELMEEEVASV